MRHLLPALFLLTALPLQAMDNTEPVLFQIPRLASGEYREEGVFRGGNAETGSLKSLKREETPSQGGERWTLEFSPQGGRKTAPYFQLKLVKAETFTRNDGTVVITEPPRILIYLRGITGGGLPQRDIARALKKSRFVKEVVPYPAIEDGDRALELILSRETLISPHQPKYAENQIVLDLK